MPDPLDAAAPALVTVEDPPCFEAVVRDFEAGVVGSGHWLRPEEFAWPGDRERTEEQRLDFAHYIRDAGHQADLERAAQRPVITVTTGPQPVVRGGAIQVTRRAREIIETGPQPVVTGPLPVVAEVTVGEEVPHADDAGGAAFDPEPADPDSCGLEILPWAQPPGAPPA